MSMTETPPEPKQDPNRIRWRRALPWWSQIFILLVVFIAGGVVGSVMATKTIHERMDFYRRHADALPKMIVLRLKKRLDLSDAQTRQVREIVERRHPRIIEKRAEVAQAMLDEFDAME